MPIIHAKVSAEADGGATNKVRPSDWNADHDLSSFLPAFRGVKAYHSTTQSMTANVTAALLLDSEEFDTDGFHSTSSNNSRITIPTGMSGYYQLIGRTHVPIDTTENPAFAIWLSVDGGTLVIGSGAGLSMTGTADLPGGDFCASAIVYLTVGQYVELWGYTAVTTENFGHANADLHTSLTAVLLGV